MHATQRTTNIPSYSTKYWHINIAFFSTAHQQYNSEQPRSAAPRQNNAEHARYTVPQQSNAEQPRSRDKGKSTSNNPPNSNNKGKSIDEEDSENEGAGILNRPQTLQTKSTMHITYMQRYNIQRTNKYALSHVCQVSTTQMLHSIVYIHNGANLNRIQ